MNKKFTVINPFSLREFYQYELTSSDQAIQSFEKLKPSNYSTLELTNKFDSLVNLFEQKKGKISSTITNEIGKTIRDTETEIDRAKITIESIRDARRTLSGDLLESQNYLTGENKFGIVRHAPLGIVLAITPFNFPVNLALHKIIPALAMGNMVLFKPHPQCFKSSSQLVELLYESGFRPNDIQLICPSNEDMKSIIQHKKISCISFTGGIKGAESISSNASMKKQLFELGGNDALVVFNGSDYKKAVDTIISQRFGCAGQRCTASKRIYLQNECYEEVKQLLLAKTRQLVVGDPLNRDVFLGPVVSEDSAKIIEERILNAGKNGARVLCGGKREGAIIHPTVIEDVTTKMELISEETFGPVAPLFKFDNIDDLISKINNSSFGLQCGVFSNDVNIAKKLFSDIDVGTVVINEGPGYRADHFPFGGNKASGIGREGARYALMEFSQLKTLVF